MPIHFPNFERDIEERQILSRGRNMYDDGCIDELTETGKNRWRTHVPSEREYHVEYMVNIKIRNGKVVVYDCDCPYDWSPICKHIVAVLYYIRDNDLYEEDIDVEDDEEDEGEDEEAEENEEGEEDEQSTDEEESEPIIWSRSMAADKNKKGKDKGKGSPKIGRKKDNNISIEISDMESEELMASDDVGKELCCQVCLGLMNAPVSMPCNAHSVCYDCALLLYKHQRKEAKGHKLLNCPTCGGGSGVLKVKKIEDIKVNLELKRIKDAYHKQRKIWIKEKESLEELLKGRTGESLKKESEQNKVNINVVSSRKDTMIEEEIEKMDLKKMEQVAIKMIKKLKANGLDMGPVIETCLDACGGNEGILQEDSKDVEKEDKKKGKKDEKKNKGKNDTRGNLDKGYPLRNLKRLKTK